MYAGLTDRRDRVASLVLVEPAGAVTRVPPRLVAGLVLRGMSVLLARDEPAAIRRLSTWMTGDVRLTDDQIELLLAAMGSFRQRLPAATVRSDGELAGITAPTLLLMGSRTRLYDPSVVEARVRRLLPTVEVEVVPDAGHGVLFQEQELVTGRILELLRTGGACSRRRRRSGPAGTSPATDESAR